MTSSAGVFVFGKEIDLSKFGEIDKPRVTVMDDAGKEIGTAASESSSLQEILHLADKIENASKYGGFKRLFTPGTKYGIDKLPRHALFFSAGKDYYERYCSWANQTGKTTSLCVELSAHLTGQYPDWWEGRRFDKPITAWLAGKSHELTRNILQKEMMGDLSQWGTGMLPADTILKTSSKSGVTGGIDTVWVKHISGGVSSCAFKSYDQGREGFEGARIDFVGLDEMPPADIYSECFTRTITKGGMIVLTATPLDGLTPVVLSYYGEADILPDDIDVPSVIQTAKADHKRERDEKIRQGEKVPKRTSKAVILAGWDHAPWLEEDAKVRVLAATPPHLRSARSTGIPGDAGGQIYPVPLSDITIEDFVIPNHYRLINALDPGWNNTAAVFGALDPDTDTLYIYADYKRGKAEPIIHAEAMRLKSRWKDAPCMIDPAGMGRSQVDGKQAFNMYRGHGIKAISADNSVEVGIADVWERMSTGRLKIFKTCKALLSEITTYRRDVNGKIIKDNDHCLHPDTDVWTDQGLIPIKDLVGKEGRVLTVGGEYVPFTNARMTQRDQEIVKVEFEDGTSILCTPDHKLLAHDGWVEAKDCKGKAIYDAAATAAGTGLNAYGLVVNVLPSGKSDVYCLEVPTTNCFAVNGGYVVHNCLDGLRYCVRGIKYAKSKQMAQSSLSGSFSTKGGSGIKYF